MADLVHQASDDQVALAICFGAVAFCGLVMYFSHHVGRWTGHIRMPTRTAADNRLSLPLQQQLDLKGVVREKAA